MNEAYRRLREGLPEAPPSGQESFPTEPRQVRRWVEALPRANQQATMRQLGSALRTLAGQRVDGGQRIGVLEVMRPVVLDGMALLERQLQGASFPLSPQKAQSADQVQGLHRLLAEGYHRVAVDLCASSGRLPMLGRKRVAQALERAVYHASRQLALAYYLYGVPPTGVWLQLHRLEGFARSLGVHQRPIDDITLRRPASIESAYGQAVLLALSNPYRFSQREQTELWQVTRDLAQACTFHEHPPADESAAFAVPQDVDAGPGYIPEERTTQGERLLWVDLGPLCAQIEQALGEQASGEVLLRFRRGPSVLASADLLRRLRAGWSHAAARSHQRVDAVHSLDTVIGLSGLHFHLAGNQDFDSFMRRLRDPTQLVAERASWAHAESSRIPVTRAKVLDQSLGGYRLEWGPSEQVRARVGELVGLAVSGHDDMRDWMVGVVRWLRFDAEGGVHAGVELLARRGTAVAVRCVDNKPTSAPRPTLRGVALDAMGANGGETLRLLVPGVLDPRAQQIEITRLEDRVDFDERQAETQQLHEVRVLEQAGDYVLLGARGQGHEETHEQEQEA